MRTAVFLLDSFSLPPNVVKPSPVISVLYCRLALLKACRCRTRGLTEIIMAPSRTCE